MSSRSLSVSAPTYFVWSVSQASRMRPKSVDPEEPGAGVVDPVPPKAGRSRRPTPIPTLNVTTRARPMAARRSIEPRPRPAAGDSEAREGPGTTGVATGGSGSVVGSVGIGSESIVVMLLVWRGALTDRTARAAPERFARSAKHAVSTWECDIGMVKVRSHDSAFTGAGRDPPLWTSPAPLR